jgi:hypothetical protein
LWVLLWRIFMVWQTVAVFQVLLGRDSGWHPQSRLGGGLSVIDVLQFHWRHMLLGAVLAAICWHASGPLVAWMAPVIAGLLLAAWTSSHGGADGGGEDGPDARDFCTDFEKAKCDRDRYAGRVDAMEYDPMEYDACLAGIRGTCTGTLWPAGCAPAQSETDACLTLLRRADDVSSTTEELLAMHDECVPCP